MKRVFIVHNALGEFVGVIEANTKEQLSLAIDDLAGEWIGDGVLQSDLDDRDWETLSGASLNISVVCDISGGNEFEVRGVQVRSYTHYVLGDV